MIHKTDISKMAKKVFRHEHGIKDPHIMHPEREWLIGLVLMVVIFAVCATWSGHVYLKNKNISPEQSTVSNTNDSVYREPQVKEALKIASKREQELSELLGVAPAPPPVEEAQEEVVASSTEAVEEGTVVGEESSTTTEEAE